MSGLLDGGKGRVARSHGMAGMDAPSPATAVGAAGWVESLGARARAAARWLDGRSLRERGLALAVMLSGIYLFWSVAWQDGVQARQVEREAQLARLEEQLGAIEMQRRKILEAHARDPNQALRAQAQSLASRIEALDQKIRRYTVTLVSPPQMVEMLEEVLSREQTLRLVRLENLGADPVLAEPGRGQSEGDAPRTGLFRHRFEIELEGGYLATLGYLRALEELPWKFFWDGFEYRVADHPNGRVVIRAYTLSPQEGFVGV